MCENVSDSILPLVMSSSLLFDQSSKLCIGSVVQRSKCRQSRCMELSHLKASTATVRLRLYDVLFLLPLETHAGTGLVLVVRQQVSSLSMFGSAYFQCMTCLPYQKV